MAGGSMLIESWISDGATAGARGRMLGRYTVVNLAATLLGQLVLIGLDLRSPAPFLVVAGLAMLACFAIPREGSGPRGLNVPNRARPAFVSLMRHAPVAAMAAFAIGLGNSSFGSLGPVWAGKAGFAATATTLLTALVVAGGAASQWPVGRLSDRLDRVRLILLLSIAATVLTCCMMVPDGWTPGLAGVAFLTLGCAIHAIYPVAAAHAYDQAAPGMTVGVASGLLLLYGAGATLGPISTAALMAAYGPDAMWVGMASAYLLLAGTACWSLARAARFRAGPRVPALAAS
jgi:MFS family permease